MSDWTRSGRRQHDIGYGTQMWRDNTSYSQGEGPDTPARMWTLQVPDDSRLRISVLTAHRYYPGQIAMYVQPFMAEARACVSETLAGAMDEAIAFTWAQINKLHADLNQATHRTKVDEIADEPRRRRSQ